MSKRIKAVNKQGYWVRRCKRCTRIYKTTGKHSRICDKCKLPTGKNKGFTRFNEVY